MQGDQVSHESRSSHKVAQPHVFIVHGHDERALQEVESIVKELGAVPVVLRDQAANGQTIIESLETHGEHASYAIVLLSGDDWGRRGQRKVGRKVLKWHDTTQLRARQNVVFEFGYFVAKLGRSRVCVLKWPRVECPSDISGVRYIEYHDGWHVRVQQELVSAGIVGAPDGLHR
jgi:predicted nucleotide-binding protein